MHASHRQVLTLSTRLSAFSYSIGVLASDMGRNFVVIGGANPHNTICIMYILCI